MMTTREDDAPAASEGGRPIFIFGSPRSGTSLVSRIVDAHPRIGVPYESLIYTVFYPIRDAYGDLSIPANRALLIRHILDWGPLTEWEPRVEAEAALRMVSRPDFHGVFEAVMRAWLATQGKPRWGEKSPWHAFHWKEILEGFPDAVFLHVVRDPRDASLSWQRARQGPRNLHVLAGKWARYVDLMEEIRQGMPADAFHEVRYERLLEDPSGEVRAICAFLGETFTDTMLDFHLEVSPYPTDQTNLANLARPVLRGNSGKWREELSGSEIRLVEAAAGRSMERLGYVPEDPDARLGAVERLWVLGVQNTASRVVGMAKDRKGQREGLQKLCFPIAARMGRSKGRSKGRSIGR